jgi:hypothetical protein
LAHVRRTSRRRQGRIVGLRWVQRFNEGRSAGRVWRRSGDRQHFTAKSAIPLDPRSRGIFPVPPSLPSDCTAIPSTGASARYGTSLPSLRTPATSRSRERATEPRPSIAWWRRKPTGARQRLLPGGHLRRRVRARRIAIDSRQPVFWSAARHVAAGSDFASRRRAVRGSRAATKQTPPRRIIS